MRRRGRTAVGGSDSNVLNRVVCYQVPGTLFNRHHRYLHRQRTQPYSELTLLRGTILVVNRTYGTTKTYIFPYFPRKYLVLFTTVSRNITSHPYPTTAAGKHIIIETSKHSKLYPVIGILNGLLCGATKSGENYSENEALE